MKRSRRRKPARGPAERSGRARPTTYRLPVTGSLPPRLQVRPTNAGEHPGWSVCLRPPFASSFGFCPFINLSADNLRKTKGWARSTRSWAPS